MKKNNTKMYLILITICLIFLVIAGRMVQLQIIKHKEYSYKAIELSKKDIDKYAMRGDILDRNNVRLAYSAKYYDLWVNKPDLVLENMDEQQKELFEDTLEVITETAGVTEEEFMAKMNDNNISNFLLKKWASKETVDAIREMDPRWLSVYESYRRVYPDGTLASNLIGTTNDDGFGRSGLEYSFNDYLAGRNGKYVMDTDLFGNQLALSNTEIFEPQDGESVALTIDSYIQQMTQMHLEKAGVEFQTEQMIGVVSDIKTNELLAVANYPSYDLNDPFNLGLEEDEELTGDDYWTAIHRLWGNPAFTYTYEPGSVSKMFTTAIGIEEGIFDMDDHWLDETAEIQVDDREIKCATHPYGHGDQTTAEALVNSCNVAYVKMGLNIGADTLYNYFEALNLTYRSGLGISGESFPIFRPRSMMLRTDTATMAFGHTYSVTPLQMLIASNAVVNDGVLMQPQLIKTRLSSEGEVVYQAEPKMVRRVFSPSTSKQVREVLEEVPIMMQAENHGFSIGGKTGTTLKLSFDEEGEFEYGEKVINSFYAFGPIDDPQYSVLVLADTPRDDARFFSAIQAAMDILADTMRYHGISNDSISPDSEVIVPDVIGISYNAADFALANFEFEYTAVGLDSNEEQVVVDQFPKPGVTVMKGTKIIIKMGPKPDEDL